MLAGVLAAVREQLPGAQVVVLSRDPPRTQAVHGAAAVSRGLWSAWRALDGASLLVSGGGGLFQDATGPLSPFYYLAILEMARWRRVPVVWWAQGIGPVRSRLVRALVARAASGAAEVVLRDRSSITQLAAWGADPRRLRLGADAAWLLPLTPAADRGGPGGGGPKDAPAGAAAAEGDATGSVHGPARRVAIAWRHWRGQPVDAASAGRALGEAAARLASCGVHLRLEVLALHPAQDADPARWLARQAQRAAAGRVAVAAGRLPEHPSAALSCLAGMDGIISVRLHGLVLAALGGVPLAGVAYDPKVEAFLQEIRWPLAPLAPSRLAEPDCWFQALEALLDRREELAAHLARQRARMVARARRSARAMARAAALGAGASRPAVPQRAGAFGSAVEDPARALRSAVQEAAEVPRPAIPKPVDILGVPMHPVSLEQAAELALRWAAGDGPMRWIVTLNPEMVMQAQRDPGFGSLLARADLLVPDGVGTVWAGRMLGAAVAGRVPGIELAERILDLAARARLPVFLLGGRPGTAEQAAARLRARLPGLVVAGCGHGYLEPGGQEEKAVLGRIASARPAVLLVGMGSPLQERWLARHRGRLAGSVRLAMGVGGSLDVWAGRTPRAPGWMRRAGMEWVFRLLREPRRARRMLALPAFAGRVVLHSLARRGRRRGPPGGGIDAGLREPL